MTTNLHISDVFPNFELPTRSASSRTCIRAARWNVTSMKREGLHGRKKVLH